MKLLKKSIWIVSITAIILLGLVCTANAQVLHKNDGCLKVLGISELDSYNKTDVISVESAASVIEKITGNRVVPESSSMEDVCDAYVKALGYGHLAGGDYSEISFEFQRIYAENKTTSVTREVMEKLTSAVLDIPKMVTSGNAVDPEFSAEDETIGKKYFGLIYKDGVVSGSYGDGINRTTPLAKNEILIENEIYYYDNPGVITDRKIEFAYKDNGGRKEIVFIRNKPDILVEEREGFGGREFFRRGIPFKEGELQAENGIRLIDVTGDEVNIQTSVMQKHPDGSIMWLSVSFMWDVEGNKSYPFYLVFDKRGEVSSEVSASTDNKTAQIKNETVDAKLDKNGISSLIYNGKEIAGEGGIRLSIRQSDTPVYFVANKFTVVESGPVYAQIRVSGVFEKTNVGAEWFIGLYQGDDRLYQEVKFNTRGDMQLLGEGIELNFADDFTKKAFDESASYENNFTGSTWYSLESDDGYGIVLASKDITRFLGAVSGSGLVNGFYNEEGSGTVEFCPIHRKTSYTWYDGISRTVRLDMSFYDRAVTATDTQREAAWAFTPPALTVASERFVYTDWIDDDSKTESFERTEKLITSLYGRLWNTFEAGKFFHRMEVNYEKYTIITGDSDRSGGEVEFNMWRHYMASGNPRIFDMISESSEFWTDMMVYRGEIDALIGANRYQSKDYNSVSFRTSMPFYGDLSGLYLSYCITGDPYYKESFKLGADHWEKSTTEGDGFPNVSYWYAGTGFNEQTTHKRSAQTRFCGQVRGLYYAYELFGDEKYYAACKNIISFLETLQREDGGFFESYDYYSREPNMEVIDDDGKPSYSDKIYIMEYFSRMLIDFYNESGYEPTLDILKKLAVHLIERTEPMGYGWSPNADDTYYKIGSERGAGASSCLQAFLSEMYMVTGDDYYLEALARNFRMFIASWNGGNTNRDMETGFSTYLKSSQTLSYIFKENMQKLSEWGYADAVALVQDETIERIDTYQSYRDEVVSKRNRRYSLNSFDTPYGRVTQLYNCELNTWPDHTSVVFDTVFMPGTEPNLWFGHEQTVSKSGVSISHSVRKVDFVSMMETNFRLADFTGEVKADVTEYTPTSMEVKLSGKGDVIFTLTDGFFGVKDYNNYKITVNGVERNISSVDNTIIDGVTLSGDGVTIRIELI